MPTLSIKNVDAAWLNALKIRALSAGTTLREYVIAQLAQPKGGSK